MKKLLSPLTLLFLIVASVVYAGDTKVTPYYQISEASKLTLLTNAKRIKIGDSYKQVIRILGQPMFDQILVSKENDQNIGRVLKYYAVIWDRNLSNEIKDQFIRVMLNNSDIVTSIDIKILLY